MKSKNKIVMFEIDGYLREWLVYRYGNPVCFDKRSIENHWLLSIAVCKRTEKTGDLRQVVDGLPIVIPESPWKSKHSTWVIPHNRRCEFVRYLRTLLKISLWMKCAPLVAAPNGSIKKGIQEWMKENGISNAQYHNIEVLLQRIRNVYLANGISTFKISKKYGLY